MGGTAAELGGGKFANGAVSAAFVHMFNGEGTQIRFDKSITIAEEPELVDVSDLFIPIGRLIVSIGNSIKAAVRYIRLAPYSEKIISQMQKRGWSEDQIYEALKTEGIPAQGKINSATRYVNPNTGKSIIVDDVTNELFHVGGKNYEY